MANNTTGNHVFRIYDDGASDIRLECWGISTKLSSNKIKTIKDTLRKGSSKVATSVPSPFARMYLFDYAFTECAAKPDGDSVYHQLVSDCLDIFHLLFNLGNEDNRITFKQWNRRERIEALGRKPIGHPHRLLANSFDLFFTNKFQDVDNITLIYYDGILLGGTSPFTVFFTSPNWKRLMKSNGISLSNTAKRDTFFDEEYVPLYMRDNAFLEYMFKFYLAYKGILNEKCTGFFDYIKSSIEKYHQPLVLKSENAWGIFINNPAELEKEYQKIALQTNGSIYLQINDINTYCVRKGNIQKRIEDESDFIINPTVTYFKKERDSENKQTNPHLPLVLVQGMNLPGTYTFDKTQWDPTIIISPASIMTSTKTPEPLAKRILPGNSNIYYPFITVSDFLEDSLVKMPYNLNSGSFFTGYKGDFEYLLPIKKEYFNYFTIEDLEKNIEIITDSAKMVVKLKVPLTLRNRKNSYILFQREYLFSNSKIATCDLGLAIFPFYKVFRHKSKDISENINEETGSKISDELMSEERFSKPISPELLNQYTIMLADDNSEFKIKSIDCWNTDGIVKNNPVFSGALQLARTSKFGSGDASSYYLNVDETFELIYISLKDANYTYSGLIIPEFKSIDLLKGNKEFTFAVDFGTSNTHISYNDKKGSGPQTFEVGENDLQVILLSKPATSKEISDKYMGANIAGKAKYFRRLFLREFIPPLLTRSLGSYSYFPINTASFEKKNFESEKPNLFGNFNIGFYINEDGSQSENNSYTTNLKWLFENRSNPSDSTRIELFLKQILIMIKHKAILNGANISELKIIWLHPISMRKQTIDTFSDKWRKTFNEVFKNTNARLLDPVPESLAPYYFLKNDPDTKIKDYENALNIDIGGGTTDIMFYLKKSNTYFSTSFKFAGNDLWGDNSKVDGGDVKKVNAFVKNWEIFKENKSGVQPAHFNVYQSYINSKLRGEDIISLFLKYDEEFKFVESINRAKPALKLVFFLHYSAIIYHIVRVLESKNIEIPRYFTFTGKGSLYLEIMCSKNSVTELTKYLISAFSNLKMSNEFRVIVSENPKESTANGAVLYANADVNDKVKLDPKDGVIINWGAEQDKNFEFKRNITKMEIALNNSEFHTSVLKNIQQFIISFYESEDIRFFLSQYGIVDLEKYLTFLVAGELEANSSKFELLSYLRNEGLINNGPIKDSYFSIIERMKTSKEQLLSETFFFYGLKDALKELAMYIVEN